ncbi:hypothetical protein CSA08_01415 [Candidatus Gracilibacteria bacterium]|nr:MAG: hypothetical protein CSA08_01415 [Candidatus Gracilibacteria bacterium]
MSIFKTKAIVLNINKNKDKNFIYSLFSLDYGRINCIKKLKTKEKSIDLGYNIDFEINVAKNKETISSFRNIKIISEFKTSGKKFSEINDFLELISMIFKKTPYGVPIYEIYNSVSVLCNLKEVKNEKILLTKLKILDILGELDENHKNNTVRKILKFVNKNNIKTILRLAGLEENILEEIRKI